MKFRIQAHLDEVIEVDPAKYNGNIPSNVPDDLLVPTVTALAKHDAEEQLWERLRRMDVDWSVEVVNE